MHKNKLPIFHFIQDVHTPYRNHFFRSLKELLLERGYRLQLSYMSKSAHGRYWITNKKELQYEYKFYKSMHFVFKNFPQHLSLLHVIEIFTSKINYLVLGASWNSPTCILILMISKLYRPFKIYFWAEANYYTTSKSLLINLFRRFIRSKNKIRIASYGFCLPNKGFKQLILAISILRKQNINYFIHD